MTGFVESQPASQARRPPETNLSKGQAPFSYPLRFPYSARHIVAVQIRQADVAQDYVRLERFARQANGVNLKRHSLPTIG